MEPQNDGVFPCRGHTEHHRVQPPLLSKPDEGPYLPAAAANVPSPGGRGVLFLVWAAVAGDSIPRRRSVSFAHEVAGAKQGKRRRL
jgi:hypothetical protein